MRVLALVPLLVALATPAVAGVCDDEEEALEALADASEAVRAADGPEGLGATPARSVRSARNALTELSACEGQVGRRALYWRALAEGLVGEFDASRKSLEALWRRKPPKAERKQVAALRKRLEAAAEARAQAAKAKKRRTAGLGAVALIAAGGGGALAGLAIARTSEASTWDALAAGTADPKDAPLYADQAVVTRREATAFGVGGGVLLGVAGALGIATAVSAGTPAKVAVGIAPTHGGVAFAFSGTW